MTRTPGDFDLTFSSARGRELSFSGILVVIKRRQRLGIAVLCLAVISGSLLTIANRVMNPVYEGHFRLLVSDPINHTDSTANASTPESEELVINPRNTPNVPNLIEVLLSPMVLSPLSRQFGIDQSNLINQLKIQTPSHDAEGILDVTLHWGDQKQGTKILTSLSQLYLNYSLNQRRETLTQGLTFLDQQAPGLRQRVADLQQELSRFRILHGFLEPSKYAESLQQQSDDLSRRSNDLQLRDAQLRGLAKSIQDGRLTATQFQGAESILAAPASESSLAGGAFNKLLSDLTDVERQLAEAQGSFRSSSPIVRSLKARMDRLRPLLKQREMDAVVAAIQSNQSQIHRIASQQVRLKREFSGNPELIKEYDGIEQRLDVARNNFTSYIKAREKYRLEVAQKIVPWRLLGYPMFGDTPVNASFTRNLILSLFVGGVAAVAACLVRDYLDPVFHTSKQIEDELGVTTISTIQNFGSESDLPLDKKLRKLDRVQQLKLQESLRNISLKLSEIKTFGLTKFIGITSSCTGEGKSTLALLLAQLFADMGHKILLVDADLRNLNLNSEFEPVQGFGLNTLLDDQLTNLSTLIIHVSSNYDFLPSGSIADSTSIGLGEQNYISSINKIKDAARYDLVIFDMPQSLDSADSLLLGKLMDGVVFVVGLQSVNRNLVQQAYQRLAHAGVPIFGIAANNILEFEHRRNFDHHNNRLRSYFSRTLAGHSGWFDFDVRPLYQRFLGFIQWLDVRN